MFGYPTKLGCLIARKVVLAVLHRPWFAGGTVAASSVQGDGHNMLSGATAFEDGTVGFLGIQRSKVA
jgi:selenocysteine lyase/cysteine desulfurase